MDDRVTVMLGERRASYVPIGRGEPWVCVPFRRRMTRAASVLLIALFHSGCDGGASCMPGAASACTCAAGASGTRVCGAAGTLGECRCEGIDAGAISDSGADDGGRADAGPDARADAGDDAGADAGPSLDGGSAGDIVPLSAYADRTCVIGPDGRAQCIGSDRDRPGCVDGTPWPVVGLTDAAELAPGLNHSCARLRTGGVACWGSGEGGQLGDGRATSSRTPVAVIGITDARGVAVGGHSCAVRADGTVWCWGPDSVGELGHGRAGEGSPVPVRVVGITDAVQVVVHDSHSCARLASGSVRCWGDNLIGQLGNGEAYDGTDTPTSVLDLDDAVDVSAAGGHVCAVRATGRTLCWGDGFAGMLGDGNENTSPWPVEVMGLDDAVDVDASLLHTCAIRAGGEVVCWGDGSVGQLGHGVSGEDVRHLVPMTAVSLSVPALALASGIRHTCAVTSDGIYCWGLGCAFTGRLEHEPLPIRLPIP